VSGAGDKRFGFIIVSYLRFFTGHLTPDTRHLLLTPGHSTPASDPYPHPNTSLLPPCTTNPIRDINGRTFKPCLAHLDERKRLVVHGGRREGVGVGGRGSEAGVECQVSEAGVRVSGVRCQ